MKLKLYRSASLLLVWALAGSGHALAQESVIEPYSEIVLKGLAQAKSREEFVASFLRALRSVDQDQDGLDLRDVERQTATVEARQRGNIAREFLGHDFDGDLQLTRDEIEQYATGDPTHSSNAARIVMERYDKDMDGVATLKEALSAKLTAPQRGNLDAQYLLELDQNGDERLTAAEVRAVATEAFDAFDKDRDGFISAEEAQTISTERELAKEIRRRREAGCVFQQPTKDATFVAYWPHSGEIISSAYIGDESIETTIIDVQVEPGNKPIYLLLGSYKSVIWRFSGSVDRIEHVAAASRASKFRGRADNRAKTSASGIIGVAADKVRIVNPDCLPNFSRQDEIAAGVPQVELNALLGRAPDVIGRDSPVKEVAIPSIVSARFDRSKPMEVPEGFDPTVWLEAMFYYHGGFDQVDPAAVVAAEPVAAYEVYPNLLGLAQLVGSGHLIAGDTAGTRKRYTILRTFPHFPANMSGAFSAQFVLPDGVQRPRGEIGQSCIISEEDAAKPNWKRLCRGPQVTVVKPPAPVLRQ